MSDPKTATPDVPRQRRWTQTRFLERFRRDDREMPARKYCFFLGSGASKSSDIPTGGELAWRWMTEIYREHHDGEKPGSDRELCDWANASIGIDGFNADRCAEFYSKLYEQRFHDDEEAAYHQLEGLMVDAKPRFGYSVLAQLLGQTRHNVVVTTNFDNLVADAVLQYTNLTPLVCGHESLARFARARSALQRPLIAKVHRDVFYAPLSADGDLTELSASWGPALRGLLREFCPVFIGYGGNDPSVMRFLASLEKGEIERGVFWLYRKGADPAYPPAAAELVNKHGGAVVEIAGFDEFMLLLHEKFGFDSLDDHVKSVAEQRADDYVQHRDELFKRVRGTPADEQGEEKKTLKNIADQPTKWWQWMLRIILAEDDRQRETLHRESLAAVPDSAELTDSFAVFMQNVRGAHDEAERLFRRALELDPENAAITGNLANFVTRVRGNHDEAKRLYRQALELDPKNAIVTANLANFTTRVSGDHDEAERLYRRAVELDSKHANITSNFAGFMMRVRGDHDEAERLYRRAVELDPMDADHAGNFAAFLLARGRFDDAEEAAESAWGLCGAAERSRQTVGELLVYGRLLDAVADRDGRVAEGRLKTLLSRPLTRGSWSFAPHLAAVRDRVDADTLAYLSRIADAVLDTDKLAALEADPRWEAVEPVPLEGPWRP